MRKLRPAAAALAWFHAMVTEGEAIRVLGATEFAIATNANLRSLCEAWLQLRYLLKCTEDPNDAGRRARVFALVEFRDFLAAKRGRRGGS
jgi:hypothetical protein